MMQVILGYDITVSEDVVTRPGNDNCDNPEVISYDNSQLCQWVDVDAQETNIDACFEVFYDDWM
ncbi:MAG: hypothetical protein R2771_15785 [Saprospiraceae bacterium]